MATFAPSSFFVNGMRTFLHGINLSPNDAVMFNADGSIEIVDKDKVAAEADHTPYRPDSPRDLSLWRGTCDEQADYLAFTTRWKALVDFEKLKATGRWGDDKFCFPLYHRHVLWAYALRIERVEEKGPRGDDLYSLVLVSLGSHFGTRKDRKNDLPGVTAPPCSDGATLTLGGDTKENCYFFKLERRPDDGFVCSQLFSERGLRRTFSADGALYVRPFLLVRNSYFSLASTIDLGRDLKAPTVPESELTSVAKILRGEQPADADWTITGSHRCSGCNGCAPVPSYHVHRARFAALCPPLHNIPAAERFVMLKGLTDEGLKLAILIAYGMPAPLPDRQSYAKELIDLLHKLFGDHFTSVVVPQWERTICRLAMDAKTSSSSMAALLHLLNVIWSAPYGWMPVAKRVAVGVLADMAHHGARTSITQWVQDEMLPHMEASNCEAAHVTSFIQAMCKVLNTVPFIEKWVLNDEVGLVHPKPPARKEKHEAEATGADKGNEL